MATNEQQTAPATGSQHLRSLKTAVPEASVATLRVYLSLSLSLSLSSSCGCSTCAGNHDADGRNDK